MVFGLLTAGIWVIFELPGILKKNQFSALEYVLCHLLKGFLQ